MTRGGAYGETFDCEGVLGFLEGAQKVVVDTHRRDARVDRRSARFQPGFSAGAIYLHFILMTRAHVFYSGRVQGVGFRYTAEKFALDLELVGWVKNLSDNRVELVCEGPKEKIDILLDQIQKSSLSRTIVKTVCHWEKPTQEFKDFCIEFCC